MHPFDADCLLPLLAILAGLIPFLKPWVSRLLAKHQKDPQGHCECGHQPPKSEQPAKESQPVIE